MTVFLKHILSGQKILFHCLLKTIYSQTTRVSHASSTFVQSATPLLKNLIKTLISHRESTNDKALNLPEI